MCCADNDYASALARLLTGPNGLHTPCVLGIYAAWGTGKSFIMNKTKTFIMSQCLQQMLQGQSDLSSRIQHAAGHEEDVLAALYRWVILNGPDCTQGQVEGIWKSRSSKETNPLIRLYRGTRQLYRNSIAKCFSTPHMTQSEAPDPSIWDRRHEVMKEIKKRSGDGGTWEYEFGGSCTPA